MLPPALGGLRFRVPPIPKPLGFREYVNDQAPHMAHAAAERRELYQNRRAQIKCGKSPSIGTRAVSHAMGTAC